MSFSTVFDFPFEREDLAQWVDYICITTYNSKRKGVKQTQSSRLSMHDEVPGMFLDIVMFRDLKEEIHVSLSEALAPIKIDRETHSVGVETVKAHRKVDLHKDYQMGDKNPFARKCNVMFNLTDTPLHIIHSKTIHNKTLLKNQVLILDVTKHHGADNRNQHDYIELFSLNLRMDYDTTVNYFKTLL